MNKNVYRRLLQLPIISIATIYIGFEIVNAGVLQHVYTAIKGSIVGQAEALQVKSGNSQTLEAIRPAPLRDDLNIPAPSDESLSLKPTIITDDEEEIQEQSIIYEVKSSDTIASVAKMFDVSKDTIRWANNLKTDVLKPGQILMILPVTGVVHEIKKGDTIETIAKKYKADKDEVYRYNGLSDKSDIVVGDMVIIPDGKKENPIVSTLTPKKPKSKSSSKSKLIETYTNNIEGYYTRPIIGGVKTQGLHGHNGIDIGSSIGTPILAAADGVVIVARPSGYNGGYGQMIIIKHANGTQTVYGHLSAVGVIEGQTVSKGESIGALGNTGKSTGPHLHFEIRGAANPF